MSTTKSKPTIETVLKIHGEHTRIEIGDDGDGIGCTDILCYDVSNPKPVARITLTNEELQALQVAIGLRLKASGYI